jgi:hypothetical protein
VLRLVPGSRVHHTGTSSTYVATGVGPTVARSTRVGALPYAVTCLSSMLTRLEYTRPDSYSHIGAGDDAICQGRGAVSDREVAPPTCTAAGSQTVLYKKGIKNLSS